MSELKTTTPKALVMTGRHNEPIYLKSEADKVITEKDKEIARLDDLAHAHNIELLCKENLIEEKDKEIAELKEERRWRKFPDEEPEELATIVVRFSDGFYDLAVYMSNDQGWDIGDGLYHKPEEVSHWMPLQSAPKEQA